MLGSHCLKGYSATQATVALSSVEAELYAMTKGAATALGVISLAADFGISLSGLVHCDASAALGIVNRQGLGKLRHINVRYLWLQEKVKDKELDVVKVPGVDNPADLFTKHLDANAMWKHIKKLGFYSAKGRAATAPKLRLAGGPAGDGPEVHSFLPSGKKPGGDSEPAVVKSQRAQSHPRDRARDATAQPRPERQVPIRGGDPGAELLVSIYERAWRWLFAQLHNGLRLYTPSPGTSS